MSTFATDPPRVLETVRARETEGLGGHGGQCQDIGVEERARGDDANGARFVLREERVHRLGFPQFGHGDGCTSKDVVGARCYCQMSRSVEDHTAKTTVKSNARTLPSEVLPKVEKAAVFSLTTDSNVVDQV